MSETGYLRRDGAASGWVAYRPQHALNGSPVYLTVVAARRLIEDGRGVVLPEGYDIDTLNTIAWLTGTPNQAVPLSERQAREIGEIAQTLTDDHGEFLRVSQFAGDERWAVTGVLRALNTGHSEPPRCGAASGWSVCQNALLEDGRCLDPLHGNRRPR